MHYCSPFMISYCFIEHALCFCGSAGFYGNAVNSTPLRQNLDLLQKVGAEQHRGHGLNLEHAAW